MSSDTEQILSLIDGKSTVTPRVGTFAGVDVTGALIDIDTQRFPARWLTGFVPNIGDAVTVLAIDGTWFLVGPTTPRPGIGVVTTAGAQRVTVTLDGLGSVAMPFVGTAPTSGQTVAVGWPGPVCLGALSTQPDSGTTPPPPPPPDPVKTQTFRATDAGSTDRSQERWWTGQPWASDSTYGAWFYGSAIKNTVPASASILSAEIYISKQQSFGGSPNWMLHQSSAKVGLPAGMSAVLAWDPAPGWQPMPAGWAAALIGGGAYWGVGLNQGGWHKFSSLAEDGMSGAVRIKWKG